VALNYSIYLPYSHTIDHIHSHGHMNIYETEITRKYWERVGGLLIEEFQAKPKKKNTGKHLVDGIIVLGEEKRVQSGGDYNFAGKDIIIIQLAKQQQGMRFLGEAFTSRERMIRYHPHSIKTVALCHRHDEEMYHLCQAFNIEMVVMEGLTE
jgi:hypothetical protein